MIMERFEFGIKEKHSQLGVNAAIYVVFRTGYGFKKL